MRSAGPKRHESTQGHHNPIKHKRKPPKGMYLDQNDLMAMVTGPPGQAEAILRALDGEVVTLKRQVCCLLCLSKDDLSYSFLSMAELKTGSTHEDCCAPQVVQAAQKLPHHQSPPARTDV